MATKYLLKDILVRLHQGEYLCLETRRNQFGDQVVIADLSFKAGRWMMGQLNCQNSLDLGFGTCRCVSHPSWGNEPVGRQVALSAIKQLITEQEADEASCQLEIVWLEQAMDCISDFKIKESR